VSDDLTRREALKTLAVSAAATFVSVPALAETALPAPLFFTRPELALVGLLAERIIPTDESSPGAQAAGVVERIDTILAGASGERKTLWRAGLAAVDRLCRERFGKSLGEAGDEEHDALLTTLSQNEAQPATPAERLFTALKSETIEAYYTSEIGLVKELQYKGNAYLADFPGCTHEKHRASSGQGLVPTTSREAVGLS
jgi:gluconate 2-dehydrogenase gamma chain